MHNFVAQYDEAQSQFILSRLHRFLDMGVNPNGIFFALVHRGQALNHALQVVNNITQACVEASKTGDLPHAIAHYDTELVIRTKAEMELSVRHFKMMYDWDALMQSPLMTIGARRVDTPQ
ncbi:hypothetical protein BJX65DRAFT_307290 [Aspergillus insuetus]